jgi:hypothetical protein
VTHTGRRRLVNPPTDARFVRIVGVLIEEGVADAAALQGRLRRLYPRAVVRERDLADEPPLWYVYRDGHWVPD